jgi:hypothetical protein
MSTIDQTEGNKMDIKDIFDYQDGNLYWKTGKLAGTIKKDGRKQIRFDGKSYMSHRLIFQWHHGYLPACIDHINGDHSDNRIENLRDASLAQNQHNRKLDKTSQSKIKNVSWFPISNKWRVCVAINGKQKHLGYFEDIELAELVAVEARDKYHGKFARHE